MSKQVVKTQDTAESQYSKLMQLALNENADISKLEKLMEMQEKWEAKEAKKTFFAALADFQKRCPMIVKKKQGHNYKYAPLGDIQMQIGDLLSECGLSYRFEQNHDAELIEVTCVASHINGHEEKVKMVGELDASGSKNAIQARGSTVTYLQRYTLIGSFGIITADEDTDGRLADASSEYITSEQVTEIDELIKLKSANKERFLKFFKVAKIEDIRATQFTRAVRMLQQKKAS